MNLRILLFRIFTFAAVYSCFVATGFAQIVSGSITGSVTDPSGAAVSGAKVAVVNIATGVESPTTTNASGYFSVANLISGTYRVDVTAPGFKAVTRPGIPLDIGRVVTLEFRLEVGNVQEKVLVTGEAPLLQTEQVAMGSTLTSQTLIALPTEGRNPTALAVVVPGVIMNTNQEGIPSAQSSASYSFQVNGQRAQLNRQLLDGVDDTEGVSGSPTIVPSTDALQEYSLVTSNYDVELGQVAGGVQLFTTKSGTNEIHGSAHEFNRVNALFARDPFTEPNGPGHFVYNQFGGTLGGPIKKNKLFLFGYYDGIRVRSGGNVLTTVPIPAFRTGDFSSLATTHPIFDPATGAPGGVGRTQFQYNGKLNVIPPSRLDPIVQSMLAKLPLPNLPGTDNNLVVPSSNPTNEDLGTIRGDYVMNDSNRAFIRYTRREGTSQYLFPQYGVLVGPGNGASLSTGLNNSLSANYTRVVTPSLVLEGRFGWAQTIWSQNPPDFGTKSSQSFGIPNLNDCPGCGGLAGFNIGGPVGGFSFGNNDHSHQIDNFGSYDFVGIATWTHGAHTLKFGTDTLLGWRDRRDTSSQGDFGCDNSGICQGNGFPQSITGSAAVPGSGLSEATFLLGDVGNFGRVVYANNLPLAHNTTEGLFAQDIWRATSRLTLTLGLRWDYIGHPTSPQKGGIANFNFSNTDTIISDFGNSSATANEDQNYKDFEPRVGLAYRAGDKTVIRAGYGRSYSIGFYGANFGAVTNDWPNATRQQLLQNDVYQPVLTLSQGPPVFVSGFDILKAAGNPGQYPTPNSTAFGEDRNNPDNYVDQWNFAIQREFPGNFTFTAAYIGNAVRHLFYRTNYNAAMPGPGSIDARRPYAAYGFFVPAYNQSNQSSSGYQALQLNGQKRYSNGLFLTGSFTWGRAYDFGSHNPMYNWNANLDRAATDYDRKFVFVFSHVWELPFGPNKTFLNGRSVVDRVVGGWTVSGIWTTETGTPFTPILGNAASLNSDCCTLRPDLAGNPNVANQNRSQWFNPLAFAVPPLYVFGNSGRNILRNPGLFRVDLSLMKSFAITERTRFELQWEAFNAFNHTNLAGPNTQVDSSTAGQITNIADIMRRMQLSATVRF
jgi:outer membrane receptor protein involved in Fe transport